jgi:hypothetical protein
MIFASIVKIITVKRKYWRARSHMRCYFVHATNISHAIECLHVISLIKNILIFRFSILKRHVFLMFAHAVIPWVITTWGFLSFYIFIEISNKRKENKIKWK